jgi:hypothetical protein
VLRVVHGVRQEQHRDVELGLQELAEEPVLGPK